MPDGVVDLRSDTVTTPTDEMRRAMASAEVGDDCYGEDPTINRLQDLVAGRFGMEAALYVPTGTMANQIALKVLTEPGAEVLCDADCHLIHHESGAAAMLSQVQLRGLPTPDGVLDAATVDSAVRPADPYQPSTGCVSVENTHNAHGGTVWTVDRLAAVAQTARAHGLPLMCDGARIFNACVALGVDPADYGRHCDVVTVSLYKGLAAPMGSLVCGSGDVVAQAWRYRRIFGGALRQAGIMAAAGIVALETMVDRLAEDHENARHLAAGLAGVAGPESVDVDRVQTNMVVYRSADPDGVLAGLRSRGVLAGLIGPGAIRFVTHKDVDRASIDRAVTAFAAVMDEVDSSSPGRG